MKVWSEAVVVDQVEGVERSEAVVGCVMPSNEKKERLKKGGQKVDFGL